MQHRPGRRRHPAARDDRGWTVARCGRAARRQIERAAHPGGRPGRDRRQAVRRQPAEGRHRQVARGRARRVPARRPDARRRRRRQARDLPAHPRARRRRADRPVPLHRAARARRPGGPHPRPLPRPPGASRSPAARSTTTACSTPSTPAEPPRSTRGGPAAGTSRQRRCTHDPPRVHDAPQARRPRRVQAPSRPDLAGAGRRDRAPGHRPDHDLRDRPGPLPLLGDPRRGGLGPAVAHRDPRPLGRDHEPADGVQRRGHRRLERASRGVQPRDPGPHGKEVQPWTTSARPRRGRHGWRAAGWAGPWRSPWRGAGIRSSGSPATPTSWPRRPTSCRRAGGRMVARAGRRRATPAAVAELRRSCGHSSGAPTILVNAAGVFGPIALIRDTDPDDWVRDRR